MEAGTRCMATGRYILWYGWRAVQHRPVAPADRLGCGKVPEEGGHG